MIEYNARTIDWYKKEVETYVAEKKNNIERTEHYQGLIDFLQWKFEQIISILKTK
ncbi:hypothetical protein HMPREF0645_2448 [Hallella bergensis DSM 17361]|uniref:Uncharacterized protein n=1 Tax=Hallella bergensis DSM 17361 TaxID=585502 RepID=D1PZR3_9BACT|nr:hypothetical protein HMPREF0645_2448 [Hallella bergensis DSM 17361]